MRRALTAAVGLVLLAGGCGIPDATEVRPLREGPSTVVTSNEDSSPIRKLRTDTTDKGEFITNYLTAAAGDYEGAAERVKQFLSEGARAAFRPQTEGVKVVRLVDNPLVNPGSPVVKIRTREIGLLRTKGILDPAADDRATTYEFTVAPIPGQQGLFITQPPPFLLLSERALEQFYTPRTIYFWNQERTGLVPDVRYLPQSVPAEQQPTQILDWLTSGPAPWLTGVAEPLPDGTKLIGNVPAITDGTLQINLSGQALPADDQSGGMQRLQKQLRWSLRPNLPTTLELSVEHAADEKFDAADTAYLSANPAYRSFEPERFVLYDGQIRRLADSYNQGLAVPMLRPQDNRDIAMAALAVSGSRSYAALVVDESGTRQALKVGATGTGDVVPLRRFRLPAPIGRPVWAKSPVGVDTGTHGLVTAGGKLYGFTFDGRAVQEVQWPGGRPGAITGVAVAPDGHRIAILAGGQLYVGALSYSEAGLRLVSLRVVHTVLRSRTAVDWSSEGTLVVAGLRADKDRHAIMDVSIDGASQTDRLPDLGTNAVGYLTASPANAGRPGEISGAIAWVLLGAGYDEQRLESITVADLAVPVPPVADRVPTAPFFLS